jgi:hypothetical protein
MRFARCVPMVGVLLALAVLAPVALAAPAAQQPGAAAPGQAPAVSPALQAAMLQGIQQVFPAELFQQVRPQFLPLQTNLYLVSHPALYWRVEQEPAAQALAHRLASLAPGWSTTLSNGPQGYGVYLTYRPNR